MVAIPMPPPTQGGQAVALLAHLQLVEQGAEDRAAGGAKGWPMAMEPPLTLTRAASMPMS